MEGDFGISCLVIRIVVSWMSLLERRISKDEISFIRIKNVYRLIDGFTVNIENETDLILSAFMQCNDWRVVADISPDTLLLV